MQKEESSDYTLKNSNIYALTEKNKAIKDKGEETKRMHGFGNEDNSMFYFLLDVNSMTTKMRCIVEKVHWFGNTVKAIKE